MFGIGSTELLVILVVALLVLGPKNLPKIAQTLGRAMGEFRKVSTEFQRTLNTEIAFEEEAEKHAKAKKEQEAVQARENKPVKAETSAAPEAASASCFFSASSCWACFTRSPSSLARSFARESTPALFALDPPVMLPPAFITWPSSVTIRNRFSLARAMRMAWSSVSAMTVRPSRFSRIS